MTGEIESGPEMEQKLLTGTVVQIWFQAVDYVMHLVI